MRSRSAYVVVQSAIPAYRAAFAQLLAERLGGDLSFISGKEHFGRGVFTDLPDDVNLKLVKNVYLFKRRMLWQRQTIRPALEAKVCVLEINPRTVSNWMILAGRKLRGRRTVLWGHAWSRSGPESRTNKLRIAMCRMADGVVLYTVKDRAAMSEFIPSSKIWVAPNSIQLAADMTAVPPLPGASDLIFSGRLVAGKKPLLALEAFVRAGSHIPESARLIFVGAGPELGPLQAAATSLGVEARVSFQGELFESDALRELYATSVASLSPGYVGLSMTQSHAYGRAMIYSDDEPHAPEVEAAEHGFNSVMFTANNVEDLAEKIIEFEAASEEWLGRSEAISLQCRTNYSVEAMVSGFVDALQGASANDATS